MFDTKSHLQRLISDLERDIREKPDRRLAELAALRSALAAISGEDQPPTNQIVIDGFGVGSQDPVRQYVIHRQFLREGSKKLAFRQTVDHLLQARIDQRVHRQDVIAKCRDMNMFGDTKDLDRDVSKYLSMDGTFAPDGDGFWKKKGAVAIP